MRDGEIKMELIEYDDYFIRILVGKASDRGARDGGGPWWE